MTFADLTSICQQIGNLSERSSGRAVIVSWGRDNGYAIDETPGDVWKASYAGVHGEGQTPAEAVRTLAYKLVAIMYERQREYRDRAKDADGRLANAKALQAAIDAGREELP